jgi:antitoxin component of MazEF toxin-antitoxin module
VTRQSEVNAARAAADEWARERGLPPSGGYSGDWYINGYLGGWWPDGWLYWVADYGSPPGSRIRPSAPVHQFTSSPVDTNMMDESEIFAQQAADVGGDDEVRIPTEYVEKFGLPNDQDIHGLIDNFEGVIRTTREQAEAKAADAEAKLEQIRGVLAA